MVETYWTFFYMFLIGIILLVILFVIGIANSKNFISNRGRGFLIFMLTVIVVSEVVFVKEFFDCCKDYDYVINDTYIETIGTVVEFTIASDDGYGGVDYSRPKFYIPDGDYYIILRNNNVEVGSSYLVRFYPNTGICEIVKKVE